MLHEEEAMIEYVEDDDPDDIYVDTQPGCSSWGDPTSKTISSTGMMSTRQRLAMPSPYDDDYEPRIELRRRDFSYDDRSSEPICAYCDLPYSVCRCP